ncbi:phenylalanine 4-monooxygenase [Aphanothece sacrum FPU3]|nr:phenylalanine 4-monooxygenase [Aphanothece sacrum FPU3]
MPKGLEKFVEDDAQALTTNFSIVTLIMTTYLISLHNIAFFVIEQSKQWYSNF